MGGREIEYLTSICKKLTPEELKFLLTSSNDKKLYKIYNIGSTNSVSLLDFLQHIESIVGLKAKRNMTSLQAGDVYQTYASIEKFKSDYGFQPKTPLKTGIAVFFKWYKSYYK